MKLSNFSKLSFGIGALGKDLCYAIISYFLMIYFTDTIGLTPLFGSSLQPTPAFLSLLSSNYSLNDAQPGFPDRLP